MNRKLIVKNILSHFCKTMFQMFYFQDLCVEENQRIFIVGSLTKNWLIITPTKLSAAVFEVAKFLQRVIMHLWQWKFNGSFHNFKIPKSSTTLLEWVLVGPTPSFTNESVKKTSSKCNISNIAQIIMRSTKSRKQVTQNTESPYKDTVETPFAAGLGILVHEKKRNEKMITYLSDLGLSLSYKTVMKTENDLWKMIVEKCNSNEDVYIPDNLAQDPCLHFAFEYIDFDKTTSNGNGEFHETTTVISQRKQNQKVKNIEIMPTNDLAFCNYCSIGQRLSLNYRILPKLFRNHSYTHQDKILDSSS